MKPGCVTLLAVLLACGGAAADENLDLDLIPEGVGRSTGPAGPAEIQQPGQTIYIENAVSLSSLRTRGPVPVTGTLPFDWQERLLLDIRKEWRPAPAFGLAYSGRLNLRAEDDLPIGRHQNVVHDLREAYASWQPTDRSWVDLGRINLKSGVAMGYNPTDFFKTRAVVEPLSVDPGVLREDRLGTFMVLAQQLWTGGSVSAAYAPRLARPRAIDANTALPGFDPGFDRTNGRDRFLLKTSLGFSQELSPELLVYREANRTQFGANLARTLGQSAIGYVEWSGGRRPSLIDEALDFGRTTGMLPRGAPAPIAGDGRLAFRSRLSLGASYTTESKLTINLEYHYDQAGFSRRDWANWFAAGKAAGRGGPAARQLWLIRSYAADQQEQVSRHALFLRADRTDAFVPRLELSGFVSGDPDGSGQAQLTASYALSDRWTAAGVFLAAFGAPSTNFGSLPRAASLLFSLAHYF